MSTFLIPVAMLSHWEIGIILVIVLLIFGPKSLPSLGRALGRGVKEFKDASTKFTDALSEMDKDETPKKSEPRQISPEPPPQAVTRNDPPEEDPEEVAPAQSGKAPERHQT